MSRVSRAWAAVWTALVVGALAGCVAMPVGGPVTAGRAEEVREQGDVVVLAQGPPSGADPTAIVEGFLLAANAEVTGEFDVTRKFLAAGERTEWDPGAETVVGDATAVEQTGDAQVTVSFSVTARIDGEGRYLEAPADAVETLRYELVQDTRGDWRIAQAPDVVVVSPRRFEQQFRAAWLYFLTPDTKMFVPEVRWFRNRNVPTAAVRALLAGPSPWLQDAVTTALPPGTELKPAAVSFEREGVAQMTLEPAGPVQDSDRGLLLGQLLASLQPLGVTTLNVRAGAGGPLLEGTPDTLPPPDAGELEILVDGQTLGLLGGTAVPVEGVRAIEGATPRSPARSADGAVRVALADPGTLVGVPVGGIDQRTLLTGTALAAPSVDRYGWVWTARSSHPGRLDAVRMDGTAVELTAGWLLGRTVEAVRVSRDGTRVAIVSRGPDGATLEVAGIGRDNPGGGRDSTGVPLTIGTGVRAGGPLTPTSSVVWIDDVTLGVLSDGDAGLRPYLVPVSGPSTPLPPVADAVELAVDRGTRSLYVVTQDGDLLRHEGGTWVAVPGVTGVLDVAGASFPG